MNNNTAQTYAQGLVQAALGLWVEQLEAVQRSYQRQSEAATRLTDPNAPPSERETAVRALIPKDAAPEVARFVRLLAQNGDLRFLEEIIRQIRTSAPNLSGQDAVTVSTAHPLSISDREKLEARLRADYGADQFHYEVEPELLGGLRVRIGDRVIDHSVAARLEALRGRLVS
ncbi:MAG TPA: ATP synthase F1 subunit delta [Ardenticatenaceae bacterium]